MKKISKLLALALALVMAMSLTACGGSEDAPETTAAAGNAGGETTAAAEGADSNVSSKDTLVYSINFAEPGAYNHWKAGDTQAASPIIEHVLEPLIRNTSEGTEYVLLESYEVDGLTVLLHIRDNVYFHNGDKMTAEDVAFSCELDRQSNAGSVVWSFVDTIEAVDDLTVKLGLHYESSNLIRALTCEVTSKAYFEEVGHEGFGLHPMGTNYFMWDQYTPGDTVILKAFDNYWGEHGTIKTLQFRFISELSQTLIELENGIVDIFQANGATVTSAEGNDDIKFINAPDNIIEYVGFNFNSEKMQDERVRQAVCHAMDREAIILSARDGMGTAAYGCMADSHQAKYNPEVENYYPYDPAKAAALMAEAGYTPENPLTVKLMTDTQVQRGLEAQQIKNMLDQVGFNVEIQTYEAAAFNDMLTGGDPEWYDMLIRGVGCAYGEPLAQLRSIISLSATESGSNPTHMTVDSHEKVQAYEDTLDEALKTMDTEAQIPMVKELQIIEREIAPVCWLFNRVTYYAMNSQLEGVRQLGANILVTNCYWVED